MFWVIRPVFTECQNMTPLQLFRSKQSCLGSLKVVVVMKLLRMVRNARHLDRETTVI